jgi:hypothetical protein
VDEHAHEWKRLPVVSLSVTYGCAGCDQAVTLTWTSAAGQTLEAFDAWFVKRYGGRFAGAMPPPGRICLTRSR